MALIEDTTARRFFPGGEDPIGRQITGVSRADGHDRRGGWLGEAARPVRRAGDGRLSRGHSESRRGDDLHGEDDGRPAGRDSRDSRALRELDPLLPLTRIVTMEQRLSDSLARRRLSMQLIVFFGAAALLLAAIGLYGVLSYVVNQRRREVGIRVALGARPRHVMSSSSQGKGWCPWPSASSPGWPPPWQARGCSRPGSSR